MITDAASNTKYPTVKSIKNYIDSSSTTGSTALTAEITRATNAEDVLTTSIATETTNRTTADATITSSLNSEITRATDAEGVLTTDLAIEVSRAITSEATKENVANKSTNMTADATSNTKYPSVKSIKNYVDASSTTGSTVLTAEVIRATNAEDALTTNIATETTDRTTADATLTTNLNDEVTRATDAELLKLNLSDTLSLSKPDQFKS